MEALRARRLPGALVPQPWTARPARLQRLPTAQVNGEAHRSSSSSSRARCSSLAALAAALGATSGAARRCRRASVALRAGGFHLASVSGDAAAAELLARLPEAAERGFALLAVPRGRAAELPALAAAVEGRLGPSTPVVAVLSGGPELSLGVAAGASGARSFALRPQSFQQDLAAMLPGVAGAAAVLLFADHAAPAAAVRQALSELDRAAPSAAKTGVIAAPPAEKGPASIGGAGGAAGAGCLLALSLPAPARAAVDLCSQEAFGPEMEVFEASLPRQGPAVLLKIGTDQEGSMEDAEETEKGTAGIARRVSIPAAAAVREAMQASGVGGPKEVWIGVPGVAKSEKTPRAEHQGGGDRRNWALFPWVGMTKAGGVVLGGRGPVAEGLCPKASLDFAQCFRTAGPKDGGAGGRLAAENRGGGAIAISSASTPAKSLQELADRAGPSTISLIGSAVLGAPAAGGPSDVLGQALAFVALG